MNEKLIMIVGWFLLAVTGIIGVTFYPDSGAIAFIAVTEWGFFMFGWTDLTEEKKDTKSPFKLNIVSIVVSLFVILISISIGSWYWYYDVANRHMAFANTISWCTNLMMAGFFGLIFSLIWLFFTLGMYREEHQPIRRQISIANRR